MVTERKGREVGDVDILNRQTHPSKAALSNCTSHSRHCTPSAPRASASRRACSIPTSMRTGISRVMFWAWILLLP